MLAGNGVWSRDVVADSIADRAGLLAGIVVMARAFQCDRPGRDQSSGNKLTARGELELAAAPRR
jgi:hypothetical protein